MPEIDVVIPTRNRPDQLAQSLERLTRQTFDGFGVIVVDDCSDAAVEPQLPRELFERLDLRVIRNEQWGGPAVARNTGIAASEATFIAFVDDDVIADPQLLERHYEALQDAPNAYAFGRMGEPADWTNESTWNRWSVRKQEIEYDRMHRGEYAPTWRQFFTANGFVRRAALDDVGGFDERFTRSEDVELALRLDEHGYEVCFVPEAVVWHYAKHSQKVWLDAVRQYARFDVLIDRLDPSRRWVEVRLRELREASPLSRAATQVLASGPLRGIAGPALLTGSRLLRHAGLEPFAMRFVGLAFNAEYQAEFSRALRTAGIDQLVAPGSRG